MSLRKRYVEKNWKDIKIKLKMRNFDLVNEILQVGVQAKFVDKNDC